MEEMGILSVLDLITHYPRRYLDRTTQVPISELTEGDEATVVAVVRRVHRLPSRRGAKPVVIVDVSDDQSYLSLSFFNQPWRAQSLSEGMEVAVSGRSPPSGAGARWRTRRWTWSKGNGRAGSSRSTRNRKRPGFPRWKSRHCVLEALQWAGGLEDPLPAKTLEQHGFASRDWSMWQVHQPESVGAKKAARRRLGFDELLRLQLVLVMRKRAVEREANGISHRIGSPLMERFRGGLPFPLTGAQERAIAEIEADMAKAVPMHRLLQGDVGAGKTLVALWCVADGRGRRVPGGADGAHRGAGRTALHVAVGHARGFGRCRARRRCGATGRCAPSCSPTGRGQATGRSCWPAWPAARSTWWWGPTRC